MCIVIAIKLKMKGYKMDFEFIMPWLLYAYIILSCLNCLIRTDFNVVVALFTYYVWKLDHSKNTTTHLLWINMGAAGLDLLWYLLAFYLWNKPPSHDEYTWGMLSGLHAMSLFVSFIGLCIKGVVVWALKNMISEEERALPQLPSPQKPDIVVMPHAQ